MSKIFVSYRRKESADIAGRLFDRLTGYFGPDSVFMDVDVLMSGADYRTQIGNIIEQCDVVLAVVGEQWTTTADDSGQRLLDNPDDPLRIEIATAFDRKIKVVPILVHGAALPAAADLPEELAALASQEPVQIQSGLPFNTDVQKLVDSLEQQHGLRHPGGRFPLELILIPLGIILVCVGLIYTVMLPQFSVYVNARLNPGFGNSDFDTSLAGYHSAITNMILYCTIPLGLGPLLIVLGNRWCCVTKDSRRERLHFSSGIGRRPTPKSGKAVLCLGCGLASLGMGAVAAIPALILGGWSLFDVRQRRGWVRGRSLTVIGLLTAVLGGIGTTYLQVTYWRFGNWLQYVEQAEKATAAGEMDRALDAYQHAKAFDFGGLYATSSGTGDTERMVRTLFTVELCELRRAEIYAQTGEHRLAIAELTDLLERIGPNRDDFPDMERMEQRDLRRQAYGLRAEMYDALGESDKAEKDRLRQRGFDESQIRSEENPVDDDGFGPAPIVDPSAANGRLRDVECKTAHSPV